MRCTVISRVTLSSLFLTISLSLLVKAFLAAIVWLSHPEGNSADGGCGETVTCFIQSTSFTQSLSFIFFYFSLRPRKITIRLGWRPQKTLGMNLRNLWLCGPPCNQSHGGCEIEKLPSIFSFYHLSWLLFLRSKMSTNQIRIDPVYCLNAFSNF